MNTPHPNLVDNRLAAHIAGVAPSTWRAWRARGGPEPEAPPSAVRWGNELREPRYDRGEVEAWVERRRALITGALDALDRGEDPATVATRANVGVNVLHRWAATDGHPWRRRPDG